MDLRAAAKLMSAATVNGGGNNITDGCGTLVVKKLTWKPDTRDGAAFIGELQVLESQSYEGSVVKANSPGSDVRIIQLFEKHKDTAPSNTKSFVMALLGITDADIVEEAKKSLAEKIKNDELEPGETWTAEDEYFATLKSLVSEEQPAMGKKIRYSTFRKFTKDKSKELVLPKWEHSPQTPEEVAAERKRLLG